MVLSQAMASYDIGGPDVCVYQQCPSSHLAILIAVAGPVSDRYSMHAAGLCFYRAEEWWTYELCFKKSVRQFHKDAAVADASDGALIQFSLGNYNAERTDADRVQVLLSAAWPAPPYIWSAGRLLLGCGLHLLKGCGPWCAGRCEPRWLHQRLQVRESDLHRRCRVRHHGRQTADRGTSGPQAANRVTACHNCCSAVCWL